MKMGVPIYIYIGATGSLTCALLEVLHVNIMKTAHLHSKTGGYNLSPYASHNKAVSEELGHTQERDHWQIMIL